MSCVEKLLQTRNLSGGLECLFSHCPNKENIDALASAEINFEIREIIIPSCLDVQNSTNVINPSDRFDLGVTDYDINDDEIRDIIIGKQHENEDSIDEGTYIIYGKTYLVNLEDYRNLGFMIHGADQYDYSGSAVVSGDGGYDIIIWAKGVEKDSEETYVLFGKNCDLE